MKVPLRARVLAGGAASFVLSLSNLGVLGPAGAAAGVTLVAATGASPAAVVATQAVLPEQIVSRTRRPFHHAKVRDQMGRTHLTG